MGELVDLDRDIRWVPTAPKTYDKVLPDVNIFVSNGLNETYPFYFHITYSYDKNIVSRMMEKGFLGKKVSSRWDMSLSHDEDVWVEDESAKGLIDMYSHEKGIVWINRPNKQQFIFFKWWFYTEQDRNEWFERLKAENFCKENIDRESYEIGVSYMGANGPGQFTKKMNKLTWKECKNNYPSTVRGKLQELVELTPDKLNGKIIILTGTPGSGKSHFIQILGTEWREWCNITVVSSPVTYLSDDESALSLFNVLNRQDAERGDGKWELIVMEDAADFIDLDASKSSGFSTLLNCTDGFIGDGLKVIFLITANEKIEKIHKAVRRAGRLHRHIDINWLDVNEVNEWCVSNGMVPLNKQMCLSDLYALKKGVVTEVIETKVGFLN